MAWIVGLSVGGGGADVSEDADLSGGGDDGLGGGGAKWLARCRFSRVVESSGKTSQTVSQSFSISAAICFWSAWKGEMMNVVEVLIDESVEVWERLRLGIYSKEGLVAVSDMALRSGGGVRHEVMLVGWGILCR